MGLVSSCHTCTADVDQKSHVGGPEEVAQAVNSSSFTLLLPPLKARRKQRYVYHQMSGSLIAWMMPHQADIMLDKLQTASHAPMLPSPHPPLSSDTRTVSSKSQGCWAAHD